MSNYEVRARCSSLVVEGLVGLTASLVFPIVCANIKVDPQQRIGQVSGLASIAFRYTLVAVILIVALILAARVRRGVAFERTSAIVCSALAGLATGFVAAGIVVALRGTPFALNGMRGDSEALSLTAESIRMGTYTSTPYPPLSLYMLAGLAELLDVHSVFALKYMQIGMTALLGPAVYLAWRLHLRPVWALAIGLTASLPLIDSAPYKPYGVLVLLVFIPLVVRYLQILRYADKRTPLHLARYGVAFGIGFGLLCLLYSGWFKWSAPGLVVAALVMFPWKTAPGRAAFLVSVTVVMFAAVTGKYFYDVYTNVEMLDDNFIYFDALLEPAYIGMFGGSLPDTHIWPPMGELGGVGLFTVVLVVGFGLSIVFGRARTIVISLGAVIAGAWLLRFWYAHLMFKTKLVQLWPRTTPELLYSLLILSGFAVFFIGQRFRNRSAEDSPIRSPSAAIGVICAMTFLLGSAASMISNRYMPSLNVPMSYGSLAWNAHHSPPPYLPGETITHE